MTIFRYRLIGLTLLMAACMLSAPADVQAAQMSAGLEQDSIYLGTQTLLVVEVADAASSEWPVVAPVDGLQITPYGGVSTMRDLFSGSVHRSYRFRVAPTRAGEFTIASVTFGSGADALSQGPFVLHVREAELAFLSARIEPPQICPGETATLTVMYQGLATGKDLVLPPVKGLTFRNPGPPRVEILREQGIPVSIYQVQVSGAENGTYTIDGVCLAGLKADPVTLQVAPFVIADAQAADASLVVGGRTLVHVLARGLSQDQNVSLVLPAGLKAERARQQYQGPPGMTVFSFEVTAAEPGSPTIAEIQLPDGRKAPLPKPLVLSVRQGGQGDILACRGTARSAQTVVGEPFIVDYEVFFRGDLQAAGIDISQAAFAGQPYIKVEPASDPSYEGWSGQAIPAQFGQSGKITLLSGSGDLDGRKEQMLRFALKVTPLAVGEVDLKGVRIILRLMIKEEQRSAGAFFSSMRTQDFSRTIDVPVHRVIDPPGRTAPPGYRGAVGTGLTYTTSLDRTTATAMSPLTLTMKISGDGVGSQLKPPPLAEVPELARDFDVSPTTSGGDVQARTITFTQVVRPRSESVKEVPALPLVYYDYAKKDYQTVYSLPIPITVTPGSVVGAAAMQTTAAQADTHSPAGRGEETQASEATDVVALGANHATLGPLASSAPLGLAGVTAVLLGGPIVVGGAWAGQWWLARRRPVAALRRQRRELVESLHGAVARSDFYVYLAEQIQAYLRLTFDLPAGELSADTIARAMGHKGVDEALRCQVEQLLAACDVGRFAPGQSTESERNRLIEQARSLFAQLDRE